MYSFERFIARGNVEIEKFFKEIGITSDEELREYCTKSNLTMPIKEYFLQEEKIKTVGFRLIFLGVE